ncbi:ubiquinone biosynthesis O-methyltransferase, mitochondrial [Ambystoma mexicanum]|uniref:ubiquinone biosynthesis O-methyltransferase, mitochondrial n=1 Tax=Ambystoma mexicanum TaxID=8296 RepID=UPI0037E71928
MYTPLNRLGLLNRGIVLGAGRKGGVSCKSLIGIAASNYSSVASTRPDNYGDQGYNNPACCHSEKLLSSYCGLKEGCKQGRILKSHNSIFLQLSRRRNIRFSLPRSYTTAQTTVDPHELKKFQAWALRWWDEEGVYSVLHSMNDLRVPFIRDTLISKSDVHNLGSPLQGVKLLDVGCGGGVLSEPLSRLGAVVTGIDPLENNIRTAELHKSFDPDLDKRIQYRACSLEDIVDEATEVFDAVIASEVVEHVGDQESFIKCCHNVLKPGGSLFITTISKTTMSYALGIVFAEKILGIVPDGTHDWDKFVTPEEMERLLESNGFLVETVNGMFYNPLFSSWSWIDNTSLNYALHAVKMVPKEHTISVEQMAEDLKHPDS